MSELRFATTDLTYELSVLARQLWQLADTAGRGPLSVPRYLAVAGFTEGQRRDLAEVIAQLLAAHGATSSPTCTYLSAIDLMKESLQTWPAAGKRISALQTGDAGQGGVLVIEDLDAFGLSSNDPAVAVPVIVGFEDHRRAVQALEATQLLAAVLMAGELPGGPVICLADTPESIDRLLDSEPALRGRFGREYFRARLGPIAAAATVFGDTVAAAAWWHEVLEAAKVSAESLRTVGVSSDVIRAVESATPREAETYAHLIDRACADPMGRLIQLVDNAWRITVHRLMATGGDRSSSMLEERYEPARRRLLIACGLDEYFPEVEEMQRILEAFAARPGM